VTNSSAGEGRQSPAPEGDILRFFMDLCKEHHWLARMELPIEILHVWGARWEISRIFQGSGVAGGRPAGHVRPPGSHSRSFPADLLRAQSCERPSAISWTNLMLWRQRACFSKEQP